MEHASYAACQVPSQSKFIEINRQLLLNNFHIWKLFCLIIEIVSEKIRKLLKMCNIIWIVMKPSCMLLRRLWQLMGSWLYVTDLSHYCIATFAVVTFLEQACVTELLQYGNSTVADM